MLIPIPIIASFNKDGKILPLYISVENEQYKILEVREKYVPGTAIGQHFECMINDHGIQKKIIIFYNFSAHQWMLQR